MEFQSVHDKCFGCATLTLQSGAPVGRGVNVKFE